MSNDNFKGVLYNDGEGITFDDLNNSQRFLAAKLGDQVFERLISDFTSYEPDSVNHLGANAPTAWAYCLSVTGGMPCQGSANNKLKIGAGTLCQKIANTDGNDQQLLMYTFDGTLEFTIANGDASHPRVDMLQMKLEYEAGDSQTRDFEDGTTHVVTSTTFNKQHRVKCTISWKTGTPATNPAYPSPDVGYVPIACVVVGTNYVAANKISIFEEDLGGAKAILHDLRMPIKVSQQIVNPQEAYYHKTDWDFAADPVHGGSSTLDMNLITYATSGTDPDRHAYFMANKVNARLVGIGIANQGAGANTADTYCWLVRHRVATQYRIADLSSFINTGSNFGPKVATMSDFEKLAVLTHDFATYSAAYSNLPHSVTGNGTHAPPVWGNGHRSPIERSASNVTSTPNSFTSSTNNLSRLGVAFAPNSGIAIAAVIFYYAEGL